ncbi:hypothetical protein ACPF7Z_00075 [Halomonas sp. GXIMD04776]|uniref:hypothetical protein n=1 Tax=Halomonas sp. GXIMD04776 TaxID=3415605 RepID=UPI003CAA8BD7
MFGWLSQHSEILGIFTGLASIIIWLGFSQALFMEMRRRRHPRLLINSGKKKNTEALCIISNMSDEPVFIEYVIAELDTSQGVIIQDVTSYETDTSDNSSEETASSSGAPDLDPQNSHQGPLDADDFIHIGTFDRLIKRLARGAGIEMQGHRPQGDIHFRSLTIRLIALYGPEDLPIAAERRIKLIHKTDYCALNPLSPDTHQFIKRWQRYRVRRWIKQINDRNLSSPTWRDVDTRQSKKANESDASTG